MTTLFQGRNFEMQKSYDVTAICNALVDILINVNDADLKALGLTKARMHLVDADAQKKVMQHVVDHDKTVELGGSCLNAVRTLAQLGLRTAFGGAVANDTYGTKIKARMAELKIGENLHISTQEPTGVCVVLITPDGERTMVTFLGASRHYDIHSVPQTYIEKSKFLHFSGYQWDTAQQKAAIREALKIAKASDCKISFDASDPFVVTNHQADLRKVIEDHADIVFANREEAELLYDTSVENAAKHIAETGATAVIKLGARGALVQQGKTVSMIEPVKTTVVDTTAAGDMFAAGFLYGLSHDRSVADCGLFAATLASDVISRIGASVSQQALDRVKNHR